MSRLRTLVLALALGCPAAGCAGPANDPVDPGKARTALHTALESWKKGDKVDALQKAAVPVYVIDPEWQSGTALKDFQLVSDGEAKDAQLYCPVRLTVVGSDGKAVRRTVTYMVSTAPNVTVSRKLF